MNTEALPKRANQLDALTGMRFLAAFLVFLHHISGKLRFPELAMPLGALAVSFFFVLSGFVLTYAYRDRLDTTNVKRFYFARWARIWPLHFVTLLVTLFYLGKFATINAPSDWIRLGANASLLHSWIPIHSFGFSFNGVSWSIATELFFYLMFPWLLIGGAKQFRWKYAAVTLGMFAVVAVGELAHTGSWLPQSWIQWKMVVHTNPLVRLFEFATGVGIGFLYFARQRTNASKHQTLWRDSIVETIAVVTLVAFSFWYLIGKPYQLATSFLPDGLIVSNWLRFSGGGIVWALFIFIFATHRGLWTKALGSRVLVYLGEISFAFYMIHMIVLKDVNRYEWVGAWMPIQFVWLAVFTISLCLSSFLYHFVELPAKSGLLSWYDGNGVSSFGKVKSAWGTHFRSPLFWAAAVLMVAAITSLDVAYRRPVYPTSANEIVQHTPKHVHDIQFGDSVELVGCQTTDKGSHVEIRMLFLKLADEPRKRFVHILDEDDEEVHWAVGEMEEFNQLQNGDFYVDVVTLAKSKLQEGAWVGLGFFHKEHGVAKLEPKARRKGWRFLLVSEQEVKPLLR